MFEKEAKERARELEENKTVGVYDDDEDLARDIGWNEGEVAGYEEGFKDGAEFDYNKANEWHKVSDGGDLPKNNTEVLVILKNKRMKISTFMENKFTIWNNDYDAYTKLYDVIAWCEIPTFKE